MGTMSIGALLRPHSKALAIALAAVAGEGLAELLQPWPLKIVFDNVLEPKVAYHHGWLARWLLSITGGDRLTTLKVAAVAGLLIAAIGGLCSYAERYLTTSVGSCMSCGAAFTLIFNDYPSPITITNRRAILSAASPVMPMRFRALSPPAYWER